VFRIDTCSLELLSSWAFGQGIATSPGMSSSGAGIATSPGMTIEGEGIATSPGQDVTGAGIATSPGAQAPQNPYSAPIAMHVPLEAGEIDFVELMNYSWSGSTMPMAVAVDTSWFQTNFPSSPIITSTGAGIATSPITLSAATSFGAPVGDASDAPDGCTPVVVRTFVPGEIADGVSPVAPDPSQCGVDCNAQATALGDIWSWAATGQGIATSPGFNVASQLSPAQYDQAVKALWAWSQFSMNEPSSPVSEFGTVLEAAGIATSPGTQVQGESDDTCSMTMPDETPLDPDAVSDEDATTDPTEAPAADAPDPTVQ
jgi:hypothetical protein